MYEGEWEEVSCPAPHWEPPEAGQGPPTCNPPASPDQQPEVKEGCLAACGAARGDGDGSAGRGCAKASKQQLGRKLQLRGWGRRMGRQGMRGPFSPTRLAEIPSLGYRQTQRPEERK